MNKSVFLIIVLQSMLWAGCEKTSDSDQSSTIVADSTQIVNTEESPEQAILRMNKLVKDNPRDYGLLEERALIWFGMDSMAQAKSDIEMALSIYPQSPDLHYYKGLFAKTENNSPLALQEFTAAVGMGTQNPEIHYELGQQFFFRQDYDKALTAYQMAQEIAPQDPQYIFAQAFLEESRGNFSKALNIYRQSLEIDSLFVKSLTSIHDLYFQRFSAVEDAAYYNDRLLLYYPSHPLGQYQKGTRYLSDAMQTSKENDAEEFESAINTAAEAFTIAINSDENYLDAYFSRGFTYLLGGQRIDLATKDFEKCLELKQDYAEALFWMGSIQEKYQDLASALDYFEQALELKPENQDFIDAVNEMRQKIR